MSSIFTSHAHQNKFVRYSYWTLAVLAVVLAATFLVTFLNNNSKAVPDGYKFLIADYPSDDSGNWTTYYVYDNRIIVKSGSKSQNEDEHSLVYDGLNTSSLVLDDSILAKHCDSKNCYSYPKVLDDIKSMINNKPSREYVKP